MRSRRATTRLSVALLAAGLALTGAACSSSDDGAAADASTTSAAAASTVAGPTTTTIALSPAARAAADALTERGGFEPGQADCIVDLLIGRLGEADALLVIGEDAPAEPTVAQEDALEAAFSGCLPEDTLGAIVGVAVQGLAADADAQITEEQAVCAGKALIAAHTLRALLFDEELLERIIADTPGLTATLTECLPAVAAESIAVGAARTAKDREAQTAVRDAFTAAKALAATTESFTALTQDGLAASGAEVTFVPAAGPSTGPTEVSWRVVGTTLYLAARATTGTCWLVRDDLDDADRIAGRIFGALRPPTTGPAVACTAAAVPDAAFTEAW